MNNNNNFFLPLSQIDSNLSRNITSMPDLLDCSVSIFLSKCHFKMLETNTNPRLFIQKFREIINEKEQEIKNIETFKCVNLNLNV